MYWSESNWRSLTWMGPAAHYVEVVTVRTVFILQNRGYLAFNYPMGGCGEYIARLFWNVQWQMEDTSTVYKDGNSASILGKQCSAWGQSNTGISCPQQFWCLHLWRYSKFSSNWATWTMLNQITPQVPSNLNYSMTQCLCTWSAL